MKLSSLDGSDNYEVYQRNITLIDQKTPELEERLTQLETRRTEEIKNEIQEEIDELGRN